MAKKLTAKQENFCLAYIETGNASEAYRQAYNAENMKPEVIHVKACELIKGGNVSVRIIELQEAHREAHNVTVDSLCAELDEAREMAAETKQPGASVSATMGKDRLHGLGLEKRQTHITGELTVKEADEILRGVGLNPDEIK